MYCINFSKNYSLVIVYGMVESVSQHGNLLKAVIRRLVMGPDFSIKFKYIFRFSSWCQFIAVCVASVG